MSGKLTLAHALCLDFFSSTLLLELFFLPYFFTFLYKTLQVFSKHTHFEILASNFFPSRAFDDEGEKILDRSREFGQFRKLENGRASRNRARLPNFKIITGEEKAPRFSERVGRARVHKVTTAGIVAPHSSLQGVELPLSRERVQLSRSLCELARVPTPTTPRCLIKSHLNNSTSSLRFQAPPPPATGLFYRRACTQHEILKGAGGGGGYLCKLLPPTRTRTPLNIKWLPGEPSVNINRWNKNNKNARTRRKRYPRYNFSRAGLFFQAPPTPRRGSRSLVAAGVLYVVYIYGTNSLAHNTSRASVI